MHHWVLDGPGSKAPELFGSSIRGEGQLARSSILLLEKKYPSLLSLPVQQFSEVRLVKMIAQGGVKPVWIIKALNP